MLASTNPRNALLFASCDHLASSSTSTRMLCVVYPGKGMNLGMNLGGLESRGGVLGISGYGVKNARNGVVGRCGSRGGDWDLEAEILEFMKGSGKPAAFPSKKELVEAGRMDLVVGIEREGGWLALGWDLEDEVVGCGGDAVRDWEAIMSRQCGSEAAQMRSDTGQEKSNMVEDESMGLGSESSTAASSFDETLSVNGDEVTGVEGILSRLEKERSTAFRVSFKEREILDHALSDYVVGHDRSRDIGISSYLATTSQDSVPSDFEDTLNVRSDTWQSWSKRRADISAMEFEAGGGDFESADVSGDNFISTREGASKHLDLRKDSSRDRYRPDFIRTRLRDLELELSAALQSLKSTSHESSMLKVSEDPSEEMRNLSDAWEFQQTEIMHAKDSLRSIRAKLAVLEGKMALAIMDAQTTTEAKQKKIDKARHALQLLRTTSVVWPNSASEVLLVGSFDGWTTQRRMVKSTTGIHSICLKLYPGVHEIKFIVDGVWRVDPLRPITRSNGFENNLLIVT
uniref:AMP-activated protein kinase glycogen-binding domain-containing protein n=1 Tax=Kalanchoe fedtschenkoi TaxID=63787 RepID=A0A7N0UJN4_KALFE